jgi:hypothetical protein
MPKVKWNASPAKAGVTLSVVRAGRESDLDGSSENDIVGVGHAIAEHVHSAQRLLRTSLKDSDQ